MDSPESDSTSNPSAFQDSSFYNYLSSLSPIKQSKQTPVGQSLSVVNFPPPPPVFTSPRINPQREISFLKRPQLVSSSAADLSSEYSDNGMILAAGTDICRPYATQPTAQLITCIQKECRNKGSVQVQTSSALASLDEFLADTLEGCVNSTELQHSPDLCSRKATDPTKEIQNDCSSPKEGGGKDDGDVVQNATETEAAAIVTSPEQFHKNPLGQNSLDHVEPLQTEGVKEACEAEETNGRIQLNEWHNSVSKSVNDSIEADLPIGYAFVKQNNQLLVNQTAKLCSSLLSSNRDCDLTDGEKEMPDQHNGTQDIMLHPAENQGEWNCNQKWLPESFQIVPEDDIHNENFGALSGGTAENQKPYDCEEASQNQRGMRRRLQFEAEEARRKSIRNSSSWNSANIVPSARSPASPMDSEASNTYHVESYTISNKKQIITFSQDASSRLSLCPFETPETHIDRFNSSVQNSGSSSMAPSMPSGIGLHLNSIGNAVSVSCGINTQLAGKDYSNVSGEKLLSGSNCPLTEDSKGCLVPFEKQRPTSQDACRLEEFSQMSPKKKRKRDINTIENEGCKRCNCKKSKCLKLYCDCFAAGVYCAEPCTCLECFNKPEYEDTVLETRQQIESRNPLAFAPKIVRSVADSPQNSREERSRTTPASARHKRGCNCKKSRCLKKYCECFQAGVGCSDGCRCEGCKNVFGKKEEMEHIKAENDRWEELSDGKLGIDILQPEQCHLDHLSPLTPMFKFSKDIPKSQHLGRRHLTSSPESEVSALTPYGKSPQSPRTSDRNYRLTKEGNTGLVPYDQELDYHIAGKVDCFSPRWDGLPEIHDPTPLLEHPHSRDTASGASDTVYCSKTLGAQLRQESGSSSTSTLRWCSSPVTPNAEFGGSKFVADPDSDNRLYNIPEDETPHILKETNSPMKAVKTSSPNQKRVSPPHNCMHELRKSSSSPGLRSGRKFILQSVPSFPPLTPYSEPKGSEK